MDEKILDFYDFETNKTQMLPEFEVVAKKPQKNNKSLILLLAAAVIYVISKIKL